MRRQQLDLLLTAMLRSHPNISDLLFSAGRPFQVESDGELRAVYSNPRISKLTAYQTERIALNIIGDNRRLLRDLHSRGACDCSYAVDDRNRFRVNIFRQRGKFAIVMRRMQATMPTLDGLFLPSIFQDICKTKNGLVLLTGATGSGKTTTLAAMLDQINDTQAVHIVTLEDPIEFMHEHKRGTFSQRELGNDFEDFASGLRSALRQAPKVILVGEIRDRATVEIALTAAETGHLVLSTLHTINAGQTINRILGMFDLSEQAQLRLRLTETLRFVVSQRLVPRIGGGRQLIQEIMGSNLRVRETISLGESDVRSFYEIIEAQATFGWITFDQALLRACVGGIEETALLYATNKAKLTRALDDANKERGQSREPAIDLRLDRPDPPVAVPAGSSKR
jgi:twitching motility protein PilT